MSSTEVIECPHCHCRIKQTRLELHQTRCPALRGGNSVSIAVGSRKKKKGRKSARQNIAASKSARQAARQKISIELRGPLLEPDASVIPDQSIQKKKTIKSSKEEYHDEIDSRQIIITSPIINSTSQVFYIDEDGERNFGVPDRDQHSYGVTPHNVTRHKFKTKFGIRQPVEIKPEKKKPGKITPQNTEADKKKLQAKITIRQNITECQFCNRMIPMKELIGHLSSSHHLLIRDKFHPEDLFHVKDKKLLICRICGKNLTVEDARVHIEKHAGMKIKPILQISKNKATKVCPECGIMVEKLGMHLAVEHPWCPDCNIRLSKADFHSHFLNVHHIQLEDPVTDLKR